MDRLFLQATCYLQAISYLQEVVSALPHRAKRIIEGVVVSSFFMLMMTSTHGDNLRAEEAERNASTKPPINSTNNIRTDRINSKNQTALLDQSLSASKGIIHINMAAGADNQQINASALALTQSPQGTHSSINLRQESSPRAITQSLNIAHIGNQTLRHSQGLIAINQAAGQYNQQVNGMAINHTTASHVQKPEIHLEINESLLADTHSGNGLTDSDSSPSSQALNSATIAPDSFKGTRGVVQVNQTAGSGNQSANLFTLSIGDGVSP